MNTEEIIRKYELASSDTYKEIRKELVNYIISLSPTTVPTETIRGMLILLKEVDSWIDAYNSELQKRKEV